MIMPAIIMWIFLPAIGAAGQVYDLPALSLISLIAFIGMGAYALGKGNI